MCMRGAAEAALSSRHFMHLVRSSGLALRWCIQGEPTALSPGFPNTHTLPLAFAESLCEIIVKLNPHFLGPQGIASAAHSDHDPHETSQRQDVRISRCIGRDQAEVRDLIAHVGGWGGAL